MDSKHISAMHIEKLGHNIPEIRERALLNIASKLERGFVYDNELARCKEILLRLFDWFKFDERGCDEVALGLIRRVLKTECGQSLVGLFGTASLREEISNIKSVVLEKWHGLVDEILALLEVKAVVPPLVADPPLSYRSGESRVVGSTASPIVGVVRNSPSVQPETGIEPLPSKRSSEPSESKMTASCLPFYQLPWQTLVAADRHVLESVEENLRNPSEPTALLNSCEFFVDVLLHDFPAEVFLQRPAIVKLFHDLLWSSPSSRIATAIVKCLEKLTAALKTRINYHTDPSTYTTRNATSDCKSVQQQQGIFMDRDVEAIQEQAQETVHLQKRQMSLPQFCINTMYSVLDYLHVPSESGDRFRRKKCQVGINTSLSLLGKCIVLLKMCVKRNLWNYADEEIVAAQIKRLGDLFVKYGEVLEHFRLEVVSSDWNEETRIVHLYLLCALADIFDDLVPLDRCETVVPKNLKTAVAASVLDPAFSRYFPATHETLIEITKSFNGVYEMDSYRKYGRVKDVSVSMSAAITFIRNWKSLPTTKNVQLAKDSLPSLQFHRMAEFVGIFVNMCTNKLSMHSFEENILSDIDFVLVSCMSHKCEEIKLETYKLCQKKVVSSIGAKLNVSKSSAPGSQILFLLRTKVLYEIAAHGTIDSNSEVQNYAEDILVHILKCKILVSNEIWEQALIAIVGVLPILTCHVNGTPLGRTVLALLDPDRSQTFNVPFCEVIKGNAALLFSEKSQTRDEAVSRLCWLLSSVPDAHAYLPRINSLRDKALGRVCRPERVIDYGKFKAGQHFYQPSGLHQVLELLSSENVEPVIRRSAITQVAVMMEDPIVHRTFVEQNGVELIKSVMKSALTEDVYGDYPDSVVACISALKSICLYNPSLRRQLSNDVDLYIYVLRGMFLFCTDERVKQDGSTLLFSLIFSEYMLGTPMKRDLSLPSFVAAKLRCPFQCNSHSKTSENTLEDLEYLIADKWSLSSLQIHWNAEWFGGLHEILKWSTINYNNVTFDDLLKLSANDVLAIKATSLEYRIEKYLVAVQRGTSHSEVISYVNKLIGCLSLCRFLRDKWMPSSLDLLPLPWKESLDRYLSVPPSGPEDTLLLSNILRMVHELLPMINSEKPSWICSLLKDPGHYFNDVMISDCDGEDDLEKLKRVLLELISTNVRDERRHQELSPATAENAVDENWNRLFEAIVEGLEFDDAEHFYNLAYLNQLLSTLVHLTSTFGWSGSRPNEPPKKTLEKFVSGLCELVGAFHCGKGPAAAESLMGLSVTRHVVLIFNHTVAEMQHSHIKNWEEPFLNGSINDENCLRSLFGLWTSRDVTLRAAVFHLFAGLAVSNRAAVHLVQGVRHGSLGIWEISISTLLNHNEASIVKENAAMLLTNLTSHTIIVDDGFRLVKSLMPSKNGDRDSVLDGISKLLGDYCFFNEVKVILKHLYVKGRMSEKAEFYTSAGNSTSSSNTFTETTRLIVSAPGLVKGIATFVYNLLVLLPEYMYTSLQENGLVRVFLSCLTVPNVDMKSTKDVSLYCDILEMDASLCSLLTLIVTKGPASASTICNTRNCLSVVLSLLNPALFHTLLPQLLYLRNKLWSAIYNLLEAILASGRKDIGSPRSSEIFTAITSLIEECGREAFLQTLCESINTNVSNDLQVSALTSMTSLLCFGMQDETESDSTVRSRSSLHVLLDCTKTPRASSSDLSKALNTLYLGNLNQQQVNDETAAGAELCSILLRLYEYVNLPNVTVKKRHIIVDALTGLLLISKEAKAYALEFGLVRKIVEQTKELHVRLSLESVDCLRRLADKKRVCPVLREVEALLGLTMNFMVSNGRVKEMAANLGLADVCHKLWTWACLQKTLLVCMLKLLCTFTTDCIAACKTFPFTSSVAGTEPRKVPSNASLLHEVCTLIGKEMEQVSRTHNLTVLQLCFHLLQNCTAVADCRTILVKNNLLQCLLRMHPAITKRQKPWDVVELMWLEFLVEFTQYPEGQVSVARTNDILELLVTFTSSNRLTHRELTLEVLRNLAFYQQNRPRLLHSDEFLTTLSTKLSSGSLKEKNIIVSIVWVLAANNQKAKLTLKCARIDEKLQDLIKSVHLSNEPVDGEDFERMILVYDLLRDGGRNR